MFIQSFKLYIVAFFFLMVASCQPAPIPQPSTGDEAEDDRGRGDRYSRTRRDRGEEARTRRHSCRNFGDQSDYKCAGDEDCEEACDELFPIKKYEDECLALPAELVYAFEELLLLMDQGQADDIDPQTLYCLLSINDQQFLDEVNGLSVRESKNFLEQIASDERLARVLGEYDEGYTILDTIMDGLSNDSPPEFFAEDIAGNGVTFLDLILDADNEAAFGWVDSYIDEICQDSEDQCKTPGTNSGKEGIFVAYCRIYRSKLEDSTSQSWKILKRSEIFKEQYEDHITNEGVCGGGSDSCDYEDYEDFRGVCEDIYGVDGNDAW